VVCEGGSEGGEGYVCWAEGAYVSPVFDNRVCSTSRVSMPSRNDSSERDMWPSWELGSMLREIALWRSRRESLMWSASK